MVQVLWKNLLKTKQFSYLEEIARYETLAKRLFLQYIWYGYNLAQENYSDFNIWNWHLSKYQMWQFRHYFL